MGPPETARLDKPAALACAQHPRAADQSPAADAAAHNGLRALCLIARLHHVAADPATLAHQLGWSSSHRIATDDLLIAARHIGLTAKRSRARIER